MSAPCGFGYEGTCCCTCAFRVTTIEACTHLGGSGECGGEPTGFACIYHTLDGGPARVGWSEHGACEAYVVRR